MQTKQTLKEGKNASTKIDNAIPVWPIKRTGKHPKTSAVLLRANIPTNTPVGYDEGIKEVVTGSQRRSNSVIRLNFGSA